METPKKRLGAGRVAFLARKEEIKTKIEAGYTMVAVYEEHQKQLGISYGQFVNYINKFIRRKPEEKQLATTEPKIAEKELSTSEYLRTRPNKKEIL